MKSNILAISALLSIATASAALAPSLPTVNVADFTQEWFTNKLDHYNYQDSRTF